MCRPSLMKNLEDATPDAVRAKLLALNMDGGLLSTLEYLAIFAKRRFLIPEEQLLKNIYEARNRIKEGCRIRGTIFATNSLLERLTRDEDVSGVADIISHLGKASLVSAGLETASIFDSSIPRLEQHAVKSTLRDEFRNAYDTSFDPKRPRFLSYSAGCVEKALRSLSEVDPELSNEISHYVTEIFLLGTLQLHAGSSFRCFGTVFLKELHPNQHWVLYLEHLVHEAAHLHLYCLWKDDPIVLNESSGLYASPLRRDARPLSGIFHAMFVLSRIIRVFARLERSNRYDKLSPHVDNSENNASNSASPLEKFGDAHKTLMKNARLTPLGSALMESSWTMAHEHA